jgi:hypothetical protein
VKPVTYCSRFISFKIKTADCLVTTYQLGEVSKEDVDDWQILRFDARPISQRDRYAVPKAMYVMRINCIWHLIIPAHAKPGNESIRESVVRMRRIELTNEKNTDRFALRRRQQKEVSPLG